MGPPLPCESAAGMVSAYVSVPAKLRTARATGLALSGAAANIRRNVRCRSCPATTTGWQFPPKLPASIAPNSCCVSISSGYWHHPVLGNLSGNYNFVNTVQDKGRHYPLFDPAVNVTSSHRNVDNHGQSFLSASVLECFGSRVVECFAIAGC